MRCTPLPKAAIPVWATQLTRLPWLVVNVKSQFMYTSMILLPVSWAWRLYHFNEKSAPNATFLKNKATFMGVECLIAPHHLFDSLNLSKLFFYYERPFYLKALHVRD